MGAKIRVTAMDDGVKTRGLVYGDSQENILSTMDILLKELVLQCHTLV